MAESFVGEIRMVGFNFAPQGWALCEGQLLSINQNTALYALLGTTYGGNGQTTFGLPDLRGRSPVGTGQGPGLGIITGGERGGVETTTLTVANMPQHSGSVEVDVALPAVTGEDNLSAIPGPNRHLGPASGARGVTLYSGDPPDTTLASFKAQGTINNIGGGMPLGIRNPYSGTYFIISLQGIFPSRN